MIKHISFDVWNTLIVANPAFAAARTEYVAKTFDKSLAEVKATYTSVKRVVDKDAEDRGIAYTTPEVYALLFKALDVKYDQVQAEAMMYDINYLFLNNPPLIPDSAKALVMGLCDRHITASIGSNSNFISGRVMYPWLKEQFSNSFSFGIFSDLDGSAKPAASFFGQVIDGVRLCRGRNNVRADEIIHVGDNIVCDVWGADEVGMRSVLVKSPDHLFTTVYSYLDSV